MLLRLCGVFVLSLCFLQRLVDLVLQLLGEWVIMIGIDAEYSVVGLYELFVSFYGFILQARLVVSFFFLSWHLADFAFTQS